MAKSTLRLIQACFFLLGLSGLLLVLSVEGIVHSSLPSWCFKLFCGLVAITIVFSCVKKSLLVRTVVAVWLLLGFSWMLDWDRSIQLSLLIAQIVTTTAYAIVTIGREDND